MDNGNKIELTHKEVALFLGDDLKKFNKRTARPYNLEEEYAKTKKNHQALVWILLAACFVFVGVGTFITVKSVSASNEKITVNIDTFNDLNLKELLGMVSSSQNLYEDALRTKENILAERDEKLTAAAQKRENDLFVLQSVAKVSSKESISESTKKIQEQYEQTVNQINSAYEFRISEINNLISEYDKNLSGFDSEKVITAKANESVIDSQKQLNDLRMAKIVKSYNSQIKELRSQLEQQQKQAVEEQRNAVEKVRQLYQAKIDLLDPDARSQSEIQDQIILETGIPKTISSTTSIQFNKHFDGQSYLSQSKAPSQIFTDSIKNAAVDLEDLNTIANRFSTIPLENTIRHYVPAMQRIAYHITTNMADAEQKMQTDIDDLKETVEKNESQIKELESGYDAICNSNKNEISQGCIINASNIDNLKIYLTSAGKSMFNENVSSLVGQIRENRRINCELVVTKNGESYSAAVKKDSKYLSTEDLIPGAKIYLVLPKQTD